MIINQLIIDNYEDILLIYTFLRFDFIRSLINETGRTDDDFRIEVEEKLKVHLFPEFSEQTISRDPIEPIPIQQQEPLTSHQKTPLSVGIENYIDEKGNKQKPVLIHRALFGSLERFIGILIEHYEGKFPFWLSPVQVVVCPITDKFNAYAEEISKKLYTVGFKVEFDHRNQKINYKIREHSHKKVPVLFIVGEKEKNNKSVTIRELSVEKQKVMPFEKAIEYLKKKKFEKKKF